MSTFMRSVIFFTRGADYGRGYGRVLFYVVAGKIANSNCDSWTHGSDIYGTPVLLVMEQKHDKNPRG